jgi:carbon-monoxide dehydrogenase medium subunit
MIVRSHQAICPFRLHRPATIDQALAAAAGAEGRAVYMAGGIDLLARLRGGERVTDLVFLPGIAELRRIARVNGLLRVGACVTHHQFESDPTVGAVLPEAVPIWRDLGNVRVRLAGTLGGNLLAGRPHYDVAPLLLALGARPVFAAGGGLLTAVEIPLPGERRLGFDRSLKPVVSVAVAVERAPTGELSGRAAVGCAYPRAVVEPLDLGQPIERAAQTVARALPEPLSDAVASAGYRRRMIGVLIRRLLQRLLA